MVAPVSEIAFIKLTQRSNGLPIALSLDGIGAMIQGGCITTIEHKTGTYYVTETVEEISEIMINLMVDR